ncbi:N-acetyltransferase [Segetibacter sp. 3557_3]|uniref:GNAT family N-acetyltransferase n=1 Tax=Segetibacter sp. 3557_3 TaxID=2547429 RepID=UPI001058AAE7|nr:GNAT family N-acetyltransferase [Segetibacter sp. 3557_3]TDH29002.1 N-acetyltransferase [Segetibacter sp. 3557_3]
MSNSNFPSSQLQVRPASFNDIRYIQEIANKTWPIAYDKILTPDQLMYMLDLFYSTEALSKQMKDNHHFFLALKDYEPIGFASFSHEHDEVYKLQKLYVLPGIQKSGTGKTLLQNVMQIARSMGGKSLLLNVNRNNTARSFYEHNGFKVVREEDIPIGNGYFMFDYVMAVDLLENE